MAVPLDRREAEPVTLIVTADDAPPVQEGMRLAIWQSRIPAATDGWGAFAFGVCASSPELIPVDVASEDTTASVKGADGPRWRISMVIRSSITINDDYSTVWTEPTGILAQIIWSEASYVVLAPGALDRLEAQLRRAQSEPEVSREPWTRMGVEKYVTQHFNSRGFEVEERVDARHGFDLLITGADGYTAAVEVKAFIGEPEPRDLERVRSAIVIPELPESISEFLLVAIVIDEESDRVETLLSVDTRGASP